MNITKLISRASLILLFLTMTTTVFVQAQQDIETVKKTFLMDKLALTDTEVEKFFPVYNQYQTEKKAIRNKYKDSDGADAKIEKMEAETTLLKKYNKKFKEVLPADKVAKLHKAEEEFKKMLIETLKGR